MRFKKVYSSPCSFDMAFSWPKKKKKKIKLQLQEQRGMGWEEERKES